jgi:hypothetical protein
MSSLSAPPNMSSPNGLIGDPFFFPGFPPEERGNDKLFVILEMATKCHPRTRHQMSSPNGLVGDPVVLFWIPAKSMPERVT